MLVVPPPPPCVLNPNACSVPPGASPGVALVLAVAWFLVLVFTLWIVIKVHRERV